MQGSPMKPAEETIMNSLENSSMAIEAGNNIGNQSDQVNKSNIDKPIIDTGDFFYQSNKNCFPNSNLKILYFESNINQISTILSFCSENRVTH